MKAHSLLIFTCLLFMLAVASCSDKPSVADMIIHNGTIYTVDSSQAYVNVVVIKDGDIVEVGSRLEDINTLVQDGVTEMIDLEGNFMMPGFIEGHGHFSGLGNSLINVNLLTAKSWEEVISRVSEKVKTAKPGEWIQGRGWHQEKWDSFPSPNIHNYPYHYDLSAISPDNPVVLIHASGHSLFANEKAMTLTGISDETPNPAGGEIVRSLDGEAIGVFEERATTPFRDAFQNYVNSLDDSEVKVSWYRAIDLAQKECLAKGITSFQDAGSKFYEIKRYTAMAKSGDLDLRLWAMARDTFGTLEANVAGHKVVGAGGNFFTCNAIKSEVDGALGAFGAWLLQPYNDKPGFVGQNTTDIYDVKRIGELAMENDMQFCVHAIGDRANRVVLDIFDGLMSQHADKDDLRWRIEHAQHIAPEDIQRFANNGIIASMQGIHCTSDAPFVEKRLGLERSKYGAYAWRSFLDAGVVIANGTDAPVEDVDPLKSFYASVTRKRADSGFEFFVEQAMTREEAMYSYTLGNAFAAFEDAFKGSISVGKVADFTILDKNLISCNDEDILNATVLYTIVDGIVKYKSE